MSDIELLESMLRILASKLTPDPNLQRSLIEVARAQAIEEYERRNPGVCA